MPPDSNYVVPSYVAAGYVQSASTGAGAYVAAGYVAAGYVAGDASAQADAFVRRQGRVPPGAVQTSSRPANLNRTRRPTNAP